ncbi:MAG: hypothetical protein K5787_14630 [Lentisphaeria bacterium]|nr:hypothetical protein [Lentisphaeria bacterium]
MAPDWLKQMIRDFGSRIGLSQFGFNEHDAAGFKTENGFRFQLEYHDERLYLMLVFPMAENTDNLEQLLEMVHPAQRLPYAVHAAYKPQVGGMFITAANIRELNQPELTSRFECLWKLAAIASQRLA